MDKIAQYQQYLREIFQGYNNVRTSPGKERHLHIIVDSEHNHYQLLSVGWKNEFDRILNIIAHVDIIDGKIWVQRDYTEPCVTDQLLDRGVPNSDIVLGFQPPYKRPYTEFATQ